MENMSHAPDPARAYNRVADAHAVQIMRRYSTSFSMAARLLPRTQSRQIAALYAMVRVADEVVDGAWPGATAAQKIAELDAFQQRIEHATTAGFSSDLVVHAFASTARTTGIEPADWEPFFDSMRSDADPAVDMSLDAYIHGSAEVVGLMCLRIFTADSTGTRGAGAPSPDNNTHRERLEAGARALGAAFQRVNFLRDLGADQQHLGRHYLVEPGATLTEAHKAYQIGLIRADLDRAGAAIDLLPRRVRPAIRAAHALFAELTDRLAATPATAIAGTRVRVPDARKAQLLAGALAGSLIGTSHRDR